MRVVRLRTAIWQDKQVTLRVLRLVPCLGVQAGHNGHIAKEYDAVIEPARDTKTAVISCGERVMWFGAATERARH
jgi:hypothetical protein